MKILQAYFFLFFISLIGNYSLFAGNLDDRNQSLVTLTPDQEKSYQSLAEAYAPRYFADATTTKQNGNEILNPADAIISPFFDGDNDWSNNPANIMATVKDSQGQLHSKFPMKAQIMYSVVETKNYYYIVYMKYEARDIHSMFGFHFGHDQDSEATWTVVKKEVGKPFGTLEFVATNADGFPRIYSPDSNLQEKLRLTWRSLMSPARLKSSEEAYLISPMASEHDKSGAPEFLKSENNEPRGLEIFVCRAGHALYKCNTEKWAEGYGHGYVYTCVPSGKEGATECYPMRPQNQRVVGYSLMSLDKLMLELYPRNEASLPADQRATLQAKREKMFEGNQREISETLNDGVVHRRLNLPAAIVRGPGEKSAEADLPNDWGLKTEFTLSNPIAIHHVLDPNNKDISSDEYIFDPYIEYTSVKAPATQPSTSASHLNSPITCNPNARSDLPMLHSVIASASGSK